VKRDLIPWEDVQKTIANWAVATRQRLDALPSEAAPLCNPTDPEHARLALEGWLASSLPIIRAGADASYDVEKKETGQMNDRQNP
jgi:hypothetical protein